jgi:YhcH/YjgK/YiaL family protein
MIVTTLDHAAGQAANTPNMQTALAFLLKASRGEFQPGRVEVDGANVYALYQAYDTAPAGEVIRFEAHQQYIDIQFVLSGEEGMAWTAVENVQNATAYNPEKDVWHGTLPAGESTLVRVPAGSAAIFFPEDAHAPKLACAAVGPVQKIVMKVKVNRD